MTLRGDDRAVTVQIGAVLLFGFLVISMSMYQVAVVPQANERVEFRHSERVSQDLLSLHGAITAAAAGDPRAARVDLGTQYPPRMFFVNPPPVSGSLRSPDAGTVLVRNANAVSAPETDDYWNGTDRRFGTDRLTYRADYDVYANAPTTVVEHGVVVDTFEDETERPRTAQTLVRNRTVTLVSLDAGVSESRVGSYAVDLRAASPATRTVAVGNETGPVVVEFDTVLSNGTWHELLADQHVTNGGHVRDVDASDGHVRVELEAGVTYRLRMAKVAVGTNAGTSAAYLTTVDGSTARVSAAGDGIVAEVRDRFNNPVEGETVEVVGGTGLVETESARTDADGRATFAYAGTGAGTLTLQIADGTPAYETVEISVRRSGSGGGWTDPGHAYVDVDGDANYEPERGDAKIADAELSDGVYDAGFYQLVIPDAADDVSADTVDLRGDMGVVLGGNVTATRTDSVGTVTIDGGSGDVVVDGGRVEANGDNQTVSITTGGAIDVRDAGVVAHGRVELIGGTVDASRALLHADNDGTVVIEATGGGVRVVDATLKATRKKTSTTPDNNLLATVPSGATVYVDGATFVDSDGALDVSPDGASSGSPANGTTN